MKENPIWSKDSLLGNRSLFLPMLIFFTNLLLFVLLFGNLYYISLNAQQTGEIRYAMFNRFYYYVGGGLFVFLLLLAPALSASSITQEREQNNLALLLCTDCTEKTILQGKLIAYMSTHLTLLSSTVPFLATLYIYGGISGSLVLLYFFFYIFSALYCTALGIFCSCLGKNTAYSTALSYVLEFISFLFVYKQMELGYSVGSLKGRGETMFSTVMIGIAGGSGSGKSTFTKRIKECFPEEVAVLYHDNYYKSNDGVPFALRQKANYDHPDAFETDLLIKHLKALRRGESISSPTYDFSAHNRTDRYFVVEPKRIILVEGILVLENPELRSLFDIKIYVEADADERIIRRIIRDVKERGRQVEDISEQYLNTVKPMHYLYVEPTRAKADIVMNSGMNDVAFDLMKTKIESLLQNE